MNQIMQTQAPSRIVATAERPAPEAEARLMLSQHGDPVPDEANKDAVATRLMDLFRRTGAAAVFDCLVRLVSGQLSQRVRSRVRYLGARIEAQEILQDVIINIYSYPARFDARRPGAFRAWSSTIVDNTIRRHLRKGKVGPNVVFRPAEILAQQADPNQPDPGVHAIHIEAYGNALSAYRLFLLCYLDAFGKLSERERFVLQMVEVRRMRYAQLAIILGIRPEALKMVVFRARRRIADRIALMLPGPRRSEGRVKKRARKPCLAIAG